MGGLLPLACGVSRDAREMTCGVCIARDACLCVCVVQSPHEHLDGDMRSQLCDNLTPTHSPPTTRSSLFSNAVHAFD